MSRPTFIRDLNGAVREFASHDKAYDFVIARNRGNEHWTILIGRPDDSAPLIAPPVEVDMSDYRTPAHITDSFDRNSHWTTEYCRREREVRAAALDASLQRIAADTGITQFLQAAE